jgi:predicted TIM-barrel fold metal-dependent hydrolase
MSTSVSHPGAAIRARLDHPVIDSDGHFIEYLPLVRDFVVEEAGEEVAKGVDRLSMAGAARAALAPGDARREHGVFAVAMWGIPARNTLDRATVMLPHLLAERLGDMGVDFAVLYPTYGLTITALADDELRCALARAFNRYSAEVFAGTRERLEPVATIPMFTPDEAIAELEFAVGDLGLKSVMMTGSVPRPVPGTDGAPGGRWIDTLAHDSVHDYDPVWAACERLGVVPTFHGGGQGWGSRMSTTNMSYNQVGNFAAAGEAICRSLVFGGVPKRFPNLRFAFQEGGVAWGASLLAAVLGHYEKRNRDAIEHYNPAYLDRDLLARLFAEHGSESMVARLDRLDDGLRMLSDPADADKVDFFGESQLTGADDVVRVFTEQFFFGCEADDPMNVLAFRPELSPHRARLRALFASDIGHWDVPDILDVVPEAHEIVDDGLADDRDFRDFVFTNPVALWTALSPSFFDGTAVEGAVARELGR